MPLHIDATWNLCIFLFVLYDFEDSYLFIFVHE